MSIPAVPRVASLFREVQVAGVLGGRDECRKIPGFPLTEVRSSNESLKVENAEDGDGI